MTKRTGMRVISLLSAVAVMCASVVAPGTGQTAEAAKKAKLKTKKISVNVGKKKKIVVKNKVKKAKYIFKSKKKKVATVSKTGVVKGVKAGKTTIVVTEKKGKKKRTVGKVKVTVKKKKNTVKTQNPPAGKTNDPGTVTNPPAGKTNDPGTATNPPAGKTDAPGTVTDAPGTVTDPPADQTDAPGTVTDPPADQTDAPEPAIDPNDSTYGITWAELPLAEEFESAENAVIHNSDTSEGKTIYMPEGGVDDSGYAVIKQSQYSGPTVFLDNRLGKTSVKYVVSAYVKAENEADMYKKVIFYGGNKYEDSKYLANKYDTIVSRKLNTEWEQILKVITVPAGKFREVRVICTAADFGIDKMEARVLADGEEEPVMKEEISEPAPDDAQTETFTMTKEQLAPYAGDANSTGWTVKDDGSVDLESGWKYYAIAFEHPIDVSKFTSIQFEGTISGDYRLSLKDNGGTFFITSPDKPDEWKYPAAFNGTGEVSIDGSGYAYYLILGTKGSDGPTVNFNLSSITFKQGDVASKNTDGLTEAKKGVGNNNPIASQRFLADPYAIEYEGTVYVYGTNDSEAMLIEEDGTIPKNNYSEIRTLNCYSSKDMVNWTDEGIIKVAGKNGPAKWAANSWAPAVTYKNIDGKDKFFIYFADNGSGIGVLEGDSPTGPWRDPIGKQLISRDTPNCSGSEVPWLFDPAVFVDDDGQGYLYFGGIGEAEDRDHPKCARVVKLGDDMVSLKGDPVEIDAPAMFEDSGINKIGDKYYFSYCTNWDGASKRPETNSLGIANIAYMVSDSPMGPWSEAKIVLKNPTSYFPDLPSNEFNNNHHCMLQRGDDLYMFYHSQKPGVDMGLTQGYRTTGVDMVTIDANGDLSSEMTKTGVSATAEFDPYANVEAGTFAWSVGTSTIAGPDQGNNRNNRVLSSIDTGDYVGLEGVAFGTEGAKSLTMSIASAAETGTVEVYVDSMDSKNLVGELEVAKTRSATTFRSMSVNFETPITGTHKLFFVFKVNDIFVDTWSFSKEAVEEEPETIEPVSLKIDKLYDISEDAGTWNNQVKIDISSLLPEEFDISQYVVCDVDASFYTDRAGTEEVSVETMSVIKGVDGSNPIPRVGKIALDDGTHQAYQNGIVSDFSFGKKQGVYSIPVENWRSSTQPTAITFSMFNRTDIQSVKIHSVTFVPKADSYTEYTVSIDDTWDLTASENNYVRQLDIAQKLGEGFNVSDYDYCTIDAEFYSDTAGTTLVSEGDLNALPDGEWNCTGKITLAPETVGVWDADITTTLYNFGRTQEGYDISLSPWCESGQPGRINYVIYKDRLDTIKCIKIKSITFKKN